MISIRTTIEGAPTFETLPIMDFEEARVWMLENDMVLDSNPEYPEEACPFFDEVEMEETLISIAYGSVPSKTYHLVRPDGEMVVLSIEHV